MNQLTTFAKVLIALLIAGLVGLAVWFFRGNGSSDTKSHADSTAQVHQDSKDVSDAPKESSTASFDYSPPKPENGVLKGVVEVGASGFNSFIIKVDKQKRWELVKADYGKSLMYEKMTTPVEIKEGLKNYIGTMTDFGVQPHNIHFVVSSGAMKVDISQKMISYIKERGFVVNTVTAEQEGKYAFTCVQPAMYKESAFTVDIGSGNTKINWYNGSNVSSLEAVGAKYFQNGVSEEKAYNEVKAKASQVPAALRNTCFIIGGVPFELAKQVRKDKERYTVLKMPSEYKAEGEKQAAGLNIYKGIQDATGCKTFVFDWDSNFTIGFLLSLP